MSEDNLQEHGKAADLPALPPHYQIRACLGEGGFGEVFEAWDSKLRRGVAIKRLKHLGDGAYSTRLVQEARLAASLRHAAFVKVYALEEGHAGLSIVMELVPGQTLKQLLAQTPPTEQQALAIARQVAEAMREAHGAGLVHGDLKPSNLMLEPSGSVRILDFGLATQSDQQATCSYVPEDQQGTIAYMAPERLLGSPQRPQSDIYALGVVLYELLTGTRPHAGLNGLALAAAQVQSSSEQWAYPAGMHPALVRLVCAMTAHPPGRRLADMGQVCERLAAPFDAAMFARPNESVPDGPPQAGKGKSGSRGKRWVLAGTALLLGLGGMWLAAPHWQSLTTMVEPYSEALEIREGLRALSAWDRPGGLDDATRRFSKVLDHNVDNAAAAAGLSMVYCLRYVTDDRDEAWLRKAAAASQQALHLNGQLALSHVAQASVLLRKGNHEMALASFERALRLDPENIFALNGKIDALRLLRRDEDALAHAENALSRHPQERVFADQIGTIHYAHARFDKAEQAFLRSIRIQPDAVFSYANLGAALASQQRQDEALQVLQQGLQVRPSAWLYGNLGNALFLRGDYVGAVAAFEAAVAPAKGDPASYLGWANLADTLLLIPGRATDARHAYARADELLRLRAARSPNDATLISRLGLYAARLGDKSRSAPLLRQALALAPADAEVQFSAGLAFELIGERQQALAAIARARKLGYPLQFIDATPELIALRRDASYLKNN